MVPARCVSGHGFQANSGVARGALRFLQPKSSPCSTPQGPKHPSTLQLSPGGLNLHLTQFFPFFLFTQSLLCLLRCTDRLRVWHSFLWKRAVHSLQNLTLVTHSPGGKNPNSNRHLFDFKTHSLLRKHTADSVASIAFLD